LDIAVLLYFDCAVKIKCEVGTTKNVAEGGGT